MLKEKQMQAPAQVADGALDSLTSIITGIFPVIAQTLLSGLLGIFATGTKREKYLIAPAVDSAITVGDILFTLEGDPMNGYNTYATNTNPDYAVNLSIANMGSIPGSSYTIAPGNAYIQLPIPNTGTADVFPSNFIVNSTANNFITIPFDGLMANNYQGVTIGDYNIYYDPANGLCVTSPYYLNSLSHESILANNGYSYANFPNALFEQQNNGLYLAVDPTVTLNEGFVYSGNITISLPQDAIAQLAARHSKPSNEAKTEYIRQVKKLKEQAKQRSK